MSSMGAGSAGRARPDVFERDVVGQRSAAVHVKAQSSDGMVRLEVKGDAPFEYTSYRPSENLYVIDLTGVSAGDAAGVRVFHPTWSKAIDFWPTPREANPIVRLEILLNAGVQPKLERTDAKDLNILVSREGNSSAVVPARVVTTSEKSAVIPAAAKSPEHERGNEPRVNRASESCGEWRPDQRQRSGFGPAELSRDHLQNPDRIVLDFSGSPLKTSVRHIASNLDPVREIRLAQFTPEVSRVVIDLRTPAVYNINAAGNTVTVAFEPKPSTSGRLRVPRPRAERFEFDQDQSQSSRRESAEEHAQTKAREIPAPAAVLPAGLTQKFFGPRDASFRSRPWTQPSRHRTWLRLRRRRSLLLRRPGSSPSPATASSGCPLRPIEATRSNADSRACGEW